MYFVYRKDKGYVNALGMSFRDFMEGKLPALPGEYPTLDDWEAHLSTIFPEVRQGGGEGGKNLAPPRAETLFMPLEAS